MFLSWFALILNVAADNPYSGQPIQHTDPACCSSKTVGGLLYSLTSQDDNSAFDCLNRCRYAREDEEGENVYCFAAGTLKVECHDRGTEPVTGTKEPITEQPGTKDPVTGTKKPLTEQPAPGNEAPILSTFTFSEGNETIVQENIFRSDTGILEWKVPAHKNYTKSVFMFHQGSNTAMLKTSDTCQLSDLPGYINVSGGAGELNKQQRTNGDNDSKIVEQFVLKAREARYGSSRRKELVSDVQDLCKNVQLVKTTDYSVNKTEFEKYNTGAVIFLSNTKSQRTGCITKTACSDEGPKACGYGWKNPAWVDNEKKGFSFHQVSSGTVCVTCNIENGIPPCPAKPPCNPPASKCLCRCTDIVDKKTLYACSLDSWSNTTAQINRLNGYGSTPQGGQRRKMELTVTQSLFFNKETISIAINTPAHGDVGALDVVMHARSDGYWHAGGLTNNRLFKLGDTCYIEKLPADVFPYVIARGIQEIKNGKNNVTKEDDEISKYAILLDDMQTEVAPLPLHIDIMSRCKGATLKRFVNTTITEKQSDDLNEGKVILLDSISSGGDCEVSTAAVNKNSGVWRYPNDGSKLFVHETLHSVTSIPCCQNPDGSPTCCQDTYPQYCECQDINNLQDFNQCRTKSALLVATGVTGTSEVINSVEILMEGRDGMYTSRQVLESGECSGGPNFPVATAYAPGAVFNDLAQICVGYKAPPASPSPQCFKFNTNAAWENDFNLEKPLTNWGSSVVLNNSWWIIGGEPDGVKTELWGGNPPFFLRNIELPVQMNQPCMAKISEYEAFVTAIPTSIAVTSNLAWIFNILTGIWTPLPNTKEERSVPACGVLKTSSGRFVVLAGGYKSSTTEIYNLDTGTTGAWTMGPSIGVDVSGASMVSVKNETELLLVGGYSTTALSDIRRMNESMSSWVPVGILTTPRFGAVALAVPLGDLPPLC